MASSSVYPADHGRIIPYTRFPLLGFPNESNEPEGVIVYRCRFGSEARIALWVRPPAQRPQGYKKYGLNLYIMQTTDGMSTHATNRYSPNQQPIDVDDAFEAQLAINYLIQKHLPQEVIDDINSTREAERNSNSEEQARSLRTHPAAGETVE
jgi:hypothetical protein